MGKNRNTATSTINLVSTDSKKANVDTESKHNNKQTNNMLMDIEDLSLTNMHEKTNTKINSTPKMSPRQLQTKLNKNTHNCNHQSIDVLEININTFE